MQYFGQCYELCSQLNDTAALHAARVQYGIARGHQLFQGYSSNIIDSSSGADNLQRLVAWKDDRATASDGAESVEADCTEEEDSNTVEETDYNS